VDGRAARAGHHRWRVAGVERHPAGARGPAATGLGRAGVALRTRPQPGAVLRWRRAPAVAARHGSRRIVAGAPDVPRRDLGDSGQRTRRHCRSRGGAAVDGDVSQEVGPVVAQAALPSLVGQGIDYPQSGVDRQTAVHACGVQRLCADPRRASANQGVPVGKGIRCPQPTSLVIIIEPHGQNGCDAQHAAVDGLSDQLLR